MTSVGSDKPDLVVQTRNLTKQFGSFTAVNDVSLSIHRKTIHALIGPNGAGKTTLFNLITKFLQPTNGTIYFGGKDITRTEPHHLAPLGMVRSFQISSIFPNLTVFENVRVALQRKSGPALCFWRSKESLSPLTERTQELIDSVGLSDFTDTQADGLSYGRKRALELATTLALDPQLLLLDEPMAGMGREDVGKIAKIIKTIGATRTVVMVEHNLSIVAELSDRITVLSRGSILADGDYQTVSTDAAVREAYIRGPRAH